MIFSLKSVKWGDFKVMVDEMLGGRDPDLSYIGIDFRNLCTGDCTMLSLRDFGAGVYIGSKRV